MIFKGSATALITPFNLDGKIDFDAFKLQIERQIDGGIKCLLVAGTTGEPSTMSDTEWSSAVDFVVKTVNKRIPVVAGAGTNCTATTIARSKQAEKLNVDGLLIVTPYYNKCTQKGLIAHYGAVAAEVSKPIIVYNVPARTNLNILPSTYAELAKIKNIDSIKEACGTIEQVIETIRLTNGKLTIYSGDDVMTHSILALGGAGIISVASNVIPSKITELCNQFFSGNVKESANIQIEINNFIKLLFCEVSPIPVKAAMKLIGVDSGKLRLPLTDMEPENLEKLKQEMKKLNIIN